MDVLLPVLKWWLALTVLGWSAVPVTHRLFRTLPDRGLAFSRPVGLLLAGYVFWLGVTIGAIPNTPAGAGFVVLALGLFGLWLALRDGEELLAFLRAKRALVWGYEWLFFVALAGWALYRAFNPAIETAGGEKYMEMAFIDAVLASPRFPPLDPWLSGFAISYYYFGYILAGMLIKLTGVLPYAAFNLIVPMTLSMCLMGAFGLGYNLVALSGATGRVGRVFGGTLTASLLALVGSLEGALEIGFIRGWNVPLPTRLAPAGNLYDWLDIKNLTLAPSSCGDQATGFGTGGWVPHRFIWWWRGSRVIHDNCGEVIHEFPFFSFMLGDVHPHLVALPFALVVAGIALAVLCGALERDGSRPYWSPRWLVLPLIVGSLGFLNAWDLPTYALLVVVAYGLRVAARPAVAVRLQQADKALFAVAGLGLVWLAWRAAPAVLNRMRSVPLEAQPPIARVAMTLALVALAAAVAFVVWWRSQSGDEASWRGIEIVRFGVWLVALALAFYLPFHVGFRSQASGIGTVVIRSRLPQWLVHFGFLFFLAVSLVTLFLAPALRRLRDLTSASVAVLVVFLPVAGVSLGWGAWTALVLASVVAAAAVAGIEGWAAALARASDDRVAGDEAAPGQAGPSRGEHLPVASTFALVCVAIGLLLTLGTEYVFVRDLFGSRMNTIFKLFFQAWTLLAIGGGYAAFAVWRRLPRPLAAVWAIPAIALFVASLAYPLAAVYSRTNGFHRTDLSLNGLRWWEAAHPDDLAATAWLRANTVGTPVILEAYGGGYQHNGRISMATGLPTVLGWEGHEHQWRGTRAEIDPRKTDVERMYTTRNEVELRDLLSKYDVRYVVLGDVEKAQFGLTDADVARFRRMLTPVFESGKVQILEHR